MRVFWLLFSMVCLAWSGQAAGQEDDWCSKRAVIARDGTPADIDDCRLWKVLERAKLREHFQKCAELARRGSVQVFGGFSFTFELNPGGGVTELEIKPSVFDRTDLPSCLERVLRKRLRGVSQGKSGAVEGRFVLYEKEPRGFSYSLWGHLVPRKPKVKPPMPGRLRKDGDALMSSCKLGSAQLVMRLCPPSGEAAKLGPSTKDVRAEQLVEACEEKLQVEKPNGWSRSDWRRERKEACDCLVGLLAHTNLMVRAAAAERLARERYWRGRRALTDAIHRMLGIATCVQPECTAVAPAGVQEGLTLVRMVRAQLRLRHWVKDEALEALARHPSRTVRLKVISEVMSSRRGKLPDAHGVLLKDPDPIVRARAVNIGCQRDDRPSQRIFLGDLANPAVEVRAAALLYAGSCAERAKRKVLEAVDQETDTMVAMLMLQALPDAPAELVIERASTALFSPCPAIRFLAARLLGRTKKRPVEQLKEALGREPNPVLKEQLVDLLSHGRSLPAARHSLRLWLQL